MRQDTPLDSVLFQLKDGGARCELWICDGETKEKLASGSLTPFLLHLESAQQQLGGGISSIKLQPPPFCPIDKKQWFNKGTIERFVRFVSTPDVLERVSALETERIKLAEASNALVTDSTSSSQAKLSFSVAGGTSPGTGGSGQEDDVGGGAVQSIPSDCLDVEAESSKKHLMHAMDARLLILEKEQAKAFARAASAGFHADALGDLITFGHCFGATRLREACENFSTLHKKMEASVEEGDPDGSGLAKSSLVQQRKMDGDRNGLSTSVRNYGRRRVWGPLVLDISSRGSSSITDSGPVADDFTGVGPSPSSDSDWEDTEESSKRPIYANVIGELEGAESAAGSATAAESVNHGVFDRQDQSQQTTIRRKGNLAPEEAFDTEIDGDSQQRKELKKGPGVAGRLSVQDAIHLFESRQKQDSALQRTVLVLEKNVKNVTQSGKVPEVQQENVKQEAERLQRFQRTPVFSPVADRSGEVLKDLIGSGQAKGQSPDLSKDLLDRSYNCLLKINSVVQDALFPKLPAATGDLQPKTNSDVGPDECEWRPLSTTPAYVLDDMFVGSKTPVAVRRQSLCTPSEYKTIVDSPSMKGRLYDQYQEIREAKKRELALMKAAREEKVAAVQDELHRRKTLSSKFPTKTIMEHTQAFKTQATRNSVVTAKQENVRVANQRTTISNRNMQLNAKPDSPTSRTGTTRKLSPGPKAASTTLRSSSRMVPSPPSKPPFNSSSSNATHRRPANLLSQSVIAEPTALQRLRTRPLPGRNVTSINSSQAVVSSGRISHPRSDSDRFVRKSLETGRVAVSGSRKPSDFDIKQRLPPSPVHLNRSVETERSPASRKYQARSMLSPEPQATEPRQAGGPTENRVFSFKEKEESLKTNEECIKQIVSCIRAQSQEEEQGGENTGQEAVTKAESVRFGEPASEPLARSISDIRYNASTSNFGLIVRADELKRTKSFKEQLEQVLEERVESSKEPNQLEVTSNCSRDLDEDMQIDEPLEKCISGRSLGSPVFSQLRASHSLPHLELSESPRTKKEQQQDKQQTVEVHPEHKSMKEQQKHQSKGLKRLLKFGRKSRASSDRSDAVERNTANDVKAVPSSVRRSLEALPKIADAASEISRNFFSTFRTKSSSDSRPRA